MKKKLIWWIVILIIIVSGLLIFTYPGQWFIGSLFSSNCGGDFNKSFNEAVKNNDINFCSNYKGDIKYGKDMGYGIACSSSDIKVGIRKDSFKDSCLEAMAYANKDIEFCKLIGGENSKGACVLDVARSKKNVSYCNVLEKENAYYDLCFKE
jgi:hypothetical protein